MSFIGIDPGATTGIAALSDKGQIIHLGSKRWDLAKIYDEVLFRVNVAPRHVVVIGVEVPDNILYGRNAGKGAVYAAICAGKNIERAKSLVSLLKSHSGLIVYEIRPRREKKWTPEYFRMAYKWDKKTNEHQRDAVRIAERAWAQWKIDNLQIPANVGKGSNGKLGQ